MLISCLLLVVANVSRAETPSSPWVDAPATPHYFAISVEDPERAARWYEHAFGLALLDDTTDENGRWRIINVSNDALFVEIIWAARDVSVENPRGIAKVGFGVNDVDAVADRVEADTGTRPKVLAFAPHGIRLLQLQDPDGNIIQLTSPLLP
jgi:predicted enzyme related to lactoylglutathione lyase